MVKKLMKKDEGGKEIIIEVGLAVIGVALLIIFRKSIATLTQTLINKASTEIDNLFNAGTNTGISA